MTPAPHRHCRFTLLLIGFASLAGLSSGTASAGGGPENVFLIVNDLSDDSKTIANHYIRWRNLPDSNVMHVRWRGSQEVCPVDKFRKLLLRPALEAIYRRKLDRQIDYLVYSAGFPWRIELRRDYPDEKFPPEFRPTASITGATYLWQYTLQKNPSIVRPDLNWYVPKVAANNTLQCIDVANAPTRAFRSRYRWTKDGKKTDLGAKPAGEDSAAGRGQRYLLSTMLGVTAGRGNSVEEVLDYLKRSIEADGMRPAGTFYFGQNKNVRSTTRHACFRGVAATLQREGARVKVYSGVAPTGAQDVTGLTTGAEFCRLGEAGAKVLPGAICEHFTSYGGDLRKKAYQMPLTDFLKHGAAGASGTIVEPRAIQAKFPLPSLHLHYYRGCSLAEAFYQSVAGPYQLLVVGDPLCQPWARPPKVTVTGAAAGDRVSGVLELQALFDPDQTPPPKTVEVFFDGRLMARAPAGRKLKLNTALLPEGRHEFRVVAASADAIETRGRVVLPVDLDNDPQRSMELTVEPAQAMSLDAWVHLTATLPPTARPADGAPAGDEPSADEAASAGEDAASPAAESWEVIFEHSGRELGRVAPAEPEEGAAAQDWVAKLRVRARELGRGPVRLRARMENGLQAEPRWIVVK